MTLHVPLLVGGLLHECLGLVGQAQPVFGLLRRFSRERFHLDLFPMFVSRFESYSDAALWDMPISFVLSPCLLAMQ